MCGIVGWLSSSAAHPVNPDVLARMRDTMVHRGPDGEGLWVAPGREVGLAFRRLAIVDLSTTANQPMTNEDGTVQVVFNGEIYNHLALRQELAREGAPLQDRPLRHRGDRPRLRGVGRGGRRAPRTGCSRSGSGTRTRRRLFLARDRVGIKPLYFSWTPHGFLFASEIKALLAHPDVEADVEPRSVYHYLSFLTTPAPLTMFRGIFKMPAGCRAFVKPDGVDEGRGLLGRAARPRRRPPRAAAPQRQGAARLRRAAHAASCSRPPSRSG